MELRLQKSSLCGKREIRRAQGFERDNFACSSADRGPLFGSITRTVVGLIFEAQQHCCEKGVEAALQLFADRERGRAASIWLQRCSAWRTGPVSCKAEDFIPCSGKLGPTGCDGRACDLAQLGLSGRLVDSSGNGAFALRWGYSKGTGGRCMSVPCDDVKRYEAIRDGLFKAGVLARVTLVVDLAESAIVSGLIRRHWNRDETDVLILMRP